MQPQLFLEIAHFHVMPSRREKLVPRERFIRYQEDLHRLAGEELDHDSLVAGDQYTYVELTDALMKRVGTDVLRRLDALVTTYWTPEYDPDFSAFGPYLHHRWGLTCRSFDVADQGSIASALAFCILRDYLAADDQTSDGLLLGVEQSTVPTAKGAHMPTPRRSSAGVARISRKQERARAQVLAASYFSEAQVLSPSFRLNRLIAEWCETFDLSPSALTVAIRRDTYLYRSFRYWDDVETASGCTLRYLPPGPSCMNLFDWLSDLVADDAHDRDPYLFVDEDVESVAAAAVLVRKI
jgi:hypothetical protein